MKKATYAVIIIILAGIVSFTSCKKSYKCHCTYNNVLVFSKDLGDQSKDDADNMCKSHDTMVAGEVWTCTTY